MSRMCKECGARCCRYFCFEIDRPTSFEEFENVRWFLMHEGVVVHIDTEGDWYIAIANKCKNLLPSLRCRRYSRRPLICRQYNIDGCDFMQGNYEYQALFTTPDQIENYARMKLGPARYGRIRKNVYARVAARSARARKVQNRLAAKAPARSRSSAKRGPRGVNEVLTELFA